MKKFTTPMFIIAVISVIFGSLYATGQYILRSGANDPLVQLAEDTVDKLNHGTAPSAVLLPQIDVAHSLAPFVVIYDLNGGQVATSTNYHTAPLRSIPKGVLTANDSGYHAVTWQPEFDVRLASVTVKADNYYVVAARSLREVEQRINVMSQIVLLGWIVSVFVSISGYWLTNHTKAKLQK